MDKMEFGRLADGRSATLYTLTNKNGMTLKVTDYGARVIELLVPDRNGELGDVVIGHKTLEEYFGADYNGCFVGRYANRIGGAEFSLNGVKYILDKNDGANSLHGGSTGYHQVLLNVAETIEGDEPSITFAHTSPDMDEGYPGELKLTVKYTLTKDNELVIDYGATTDKETIYNPTNHSFFNLSGDHNKDILDTELMINSDSITLVSDDLIPTGDIQSVEGTEFDFGTAKTLGKDMFADEYTIQLNGGFDHNFCVAGEGFRKFAEAYEPSSGRVMEVYSDLPAIQLYTSNKGKGKNKDGSEIKEHRAFCLETQYYPDSPNKPNFPFKTVKPNEKFETRTIYKFSAR